jgi:hypothetical protein
MRLSKVTLVAITLGIGIVCAKARLVLGLSVKGLVDPADLIIAGKVERVQQTGTGSIELNGMDYTRLDFQAEMRVDETITGGPAPSSFTFSYSTPAVDSVGNVAEGGFSTPPALGRRAEETSFLARPESRGNVATMQRRLPR